MNNYENSEAYGIVIGLVSFLFALAYAFYLFKKYNLAQKATSSFLLLSAIGHFIGAYALYEFAITSGADSVFYFENATLEYKGLGYWFAFTILGYAREYLLGDSFLGAFLLSGALGLIGSVYLVISYKILLDKLGGRFYFLDGKQLYYPAALLLCWPSYFFWSAGIVKDNFAFFAITLIFFVIVKGRFTFSSLCAFTIATVLGFMVRPYLFLIFAVATFIYLFLGSKLNIAYKAGFVFLLGFLLVILMPTLADHGFNMNGSFSISELGKYAVRQQGYMAIGSSIPVPTHNPYATFFFLPYLIFANLLLPLGIGARNLLGAISSVENVYLLWLVGFLIANRDIWKQLKTKIRIVRFLMIYFFVGMSCLSIMCTNLGLAMREKMMYVPALLICIFLTYAYKRILIIKNYNQQLQK